MVKRILAIVAIFACSCVAWMILGTSIYLRTESAGSALSGRVASTWGEAQEQHPPAVSYLGAGKKKGEGEEHGKKGKKTEMGEGARNGPLDWGKIAADFQVD